jgi:DNA ligase-1
MHRPSPLPLHASITVQGSGTNSYVITHAENKKGDKYYYCTCPSWKFLSMPIEQRTCKHITAILNGSVTPVRASAPAKHVSTATPKRKNDAADFEVALAEKWTSEDPVSFYMSEKLDGMRCIWDGTILKSRNGNPINAPNHLTDQLTAMPLDGELFMGRGKFQDVMSVCRRQTPNISDWSLVKFMVFDAPLVQKGFPERLDAIKQELVGCEWAMLHPHKPCKGRTHVMSELDRILQLGGEGLMLRKPHEHYKGGRTTDLLKVKRFHDEEAVVVGVEQGSGRNAGRMGALICVDVKGVTFKVGTGFNDNMRDNPPSYGATITYKYQEKTRDGKPRFPVFVRIAVSD